MTFLEHSEIALNICRGISFVVAILIITTIAERMMPLRSVEQNRWEWELRPCSRFPTINRSGWFQVLIFTLASFGIGGLFRLLVGIVRPRKLSTVLASGVTQTMTRVTSMFFDSEIAADMYAASWLRGSRIKHRRYKRTTLPMLMLKRVLRRGYISLLFIATVLFGFGVVPFLGSGGRTLLVLIWAMLTSSVWRATQLEVPGQLRWRIAFTGVLVILGAVTQFLPGMPSHPIQATLWSMVAISYGAIVRGRPRSNTNFSSFDVGIGAPLEIGKMKYWLSGGLAVIPAFAAELASTM